MAGKRTDHNQIDPRHTGSVAHGSEPLDESVMEQSKQAFTESEADEPATLIPRKRENPALADLKARRDAKNAG